MLPVGNGGEAICVSETIGLYLGLKRGQKADFEIIGLTAVAFAEVVREIAEIIEPGLEFRLEFDSGTKSSLTLNGILKSLKTPEGRKNAVIGLIATVTLVLINDVRSYFIADLLDSFLAPEQRAQLSEEDVQRIARRVSEVLDGKIAKEPTQELFRQLERDEAVETVGAITKPDTKPINPIPRSDFSSRAGIVAELETTVRKRTKKSVERLVLVSPVLLKKDRAWRLATPLGEFGYVIKDEKFLTDLLSGKRSLAMKEGIELTAEIETHEELECGVWTIVDRHVTKVRRVHRGSKEPDLFAHPKKRKPRKKE